jgi:hypothetical protein
LFRAQAPVQKIFDVYIYLGNIYLGWQGLSNDDRIIVANPPVTLGQWNHVAVTWQGSNTSYYFNGVLKSSLGGLDSSWDTTVTSSEVGGDTISLQYAPVTVSDFRIYNRALAPVELSTLFNSKSRIILTEGLQYYWPLDDGAHGAIAAGATVRDVTRNAANATPTSSPFWEAESWINYP